MTKEQAKALIQKYNAGAASQQEQNLVENWYAQFAIDQSTGLQEQDYEKITAEIWANMPPEAKKETRLWSRLSLAASIALVMGTGYYWYQHKAVAPVANQVTENQIKPGGNKAYLILSNGKRIALSDAANGQLAKEAGMEISKTADGQIVYTQTSQAGSSQYNTIETPKGGTYQVRLPDGSKVWLNAASKLTYPLSFVSRAGRKVELSGEAYFEVAKIPGTLPKRNLPFTVKTSDQEVEVLGTHFNVNSYTDETDVKTTLLEGLVRINTRPTGETEPGILLEPGHQSVLNKKSKTIQICKVDTLDAVAWKNGLFSFSNESLGSITRKLARWYDVEVQYQDPLENTKFSGTLSRFDNVNKIFSLLQTTGIVQFKIEGRKITVSKQQ